jgi:phage baseplate assembly protein gpV
MTGEFQNPSYQNPAKQTLDSLLDAFRYDLLKNLNCVKIGTIKSYNATLQEVTVQIAFTQVTSISPGGVKTFAQYPLLLNVPIQYPSGGGFTLTFPIAAGDECVVLFNDRSIDNWLAQGAGQPPNIGRVHDLSDGIAIVGIRNNTRALTGVSTTTTQLRNDDGDTYVEVAGGGVINVVAPTQVNITAPTVDINASMQINLNTPIVAISGILAVDNVGAVTTSCTINGSLHTTGDVVANGISLDSHVHSGVQTGSGNTGGPH